MMSRRSIIGFGLAATALAASGLITIRYRQAIAAARADVTGRSEVIRSRFGALEYAERGEGPPILMIHGSGGGFDQGLLFGAGLSAAGYRIIAPSRFGYLRSDYPADPSPENQADAFIDLLDALGVEKVAVAGLSAGALSAIAFALRYPQRCAALLPIVPAAYVPGRSSPAPWSSAQEVGVNLVLRSDFLFWAMLKVAPDFVTESILATDPALITTDEARAQVAAIRQSILPVSARARGLLDDMRRSADPPHLPYERIAVPTLAISAEDDRYGTAMAARFIGQTTPDARAHIFPDGGHILLGWERELTALVDSLLREIGYAPSNRPTSFPSGPETAHSGAYRSLRS